MVLLDTRMPAPQCNRRNEAVVIGMRLARRTKALGLVLRGLPCLERSLICPVSVCFLTSLLMTVWLMSKLTQIFLQDIPAPCIPIICHLRYIFRYFSLWHIKIVPYPTRYGLTKARKLHFSNLYPIVFQPLTRSRRDTHTAWNIMWILRCPCSISWDSTWWSDCSVIFIINDSFMWCLINAHVHIWRVPIHTSLCGSPSNWLNILTEIQSKFEIYSIHSYFPKWSIQ